MKKISKILIILLCTMIVFSGCSQSKHSNDVVYVDEEGNENENEKATNEEVTVLLPYFNQKQINKETFLRINLLDKVAEQFYTEKGIKINFVQLNANSKEDYIKKMNTTLFREQGPTLIYIDKSSTNLKDDYIKNGVALNIKGKISNANNIYDTLKSEYYIPINMEAYFSYLQTGIIKELGCKIPDYNWTKEDYYEIYDKWLEKEKPYLVGSCFIELYRKYEFHLYSQEGYVNFDNSIIKGNINKLKEEISSGKYNIYPNYKYENYYNSAYVWDSEEYKKAFDNRKSKMKDRFTVSFGSFNALDAFGLNQHVENFYSDILDIHDDDYLLLPNILYPYISTDGFIMNKRGENIEIGLEFINFILRDDIQLYLTNYSREERTGEFASVVKTIEEDIDKIIELEDMDQRIIKVRETILNRIKNEEKKETLFNQETKKQRTLENEFEKLVFEIVFADTEYSDKRIDSILNEFEKKYKNYFSE